jgi:hypothetical protein
MLGMIYTLVMNLLEGILHYPLFVMLIFFTIGIMLA